MNNIHKTLTETNARLKKICMQKGFSFIDNSGYKEFHLGNRKLHLNKKENSGNSSILQTGQIDLFFPMT